VNSFDSDTIGLPLEPGGHGSHLGGTGAPPQHHSLTRGSEGQLGKRGSLSAHRRGRPVVAGVLPGVAPSATIRPAALADSIGLVLFWGGLSLRLWSFRTLGRYSLSPSRRAVISR
jgi:hypothetical protein